MFSLYDLNVFDEAQSAPTQLLTETETAMLVVLVVLQDKDEKEEE